MGSILALFCVFRAFRGPTVFSKIKEKDDLVWSLFFTFRFYITPFMPSTA